MRLLSHCRDFLKPTATRGIFLIEWTAFVLFSLLRHELTSTHQVLVALYPLIILYLVACELATLSHAICPGIRGRRVLLVALSLFVVDQASKALVASFLPFQASIPVVAGWLHVAHERNVQGSWLMSAFGLPRAATFVLLIVVAATLPWLVLCYRYYVSTRRKSVWASVAFVTLFAGLASWLWDVSVRGDVLDWISLPGVITTDVKDFLLTLGGASLAAEALDRPDVSWRWRGWRAEGRDLDRQFREFASYAIREIRGIGHNATGSSGKKPPQPGPR